MKSTDKTKVKRLPKRGFYDFETVASILDAGYICHVGFVHADAPVVIPTIYGRINDKLLIHGASMSRMLTTLEQGVPVSISVALVDGIVLARSAFNHSLNYRSVVLFGKARPVRAKKYKLEALKAISDHIIPGRWKEARQPTDGELKATTVLEIPIEEASAKIRAGDPSDNKKDYEQDIWAGVLPLVRKAGTPIPDTKLKEGIAVPPSVIGLLKG